MSDDCSGGGECWTDSAWADLSVPSEQLDDWLRLLGDRSCRFVCYRLLLAEQDSLSLDDLRDWLVEHGVGPERLDRVEVELHHRTIPRLSDAGLVDYDVRNGTVRRRTEALREDLLCRIGTLETDVSVPGSDTPGEPCRD